MYSNGRTSKRHGVSDRFVLVCIIAFITVLYLGIAYRRIRKVGRAQLDAQRLSQQEQQPVQEEVFEAYDDTIIGLDDAIKLASNTQVATASISATTTTTESKPHVHPHNGTVHLPSGLELPAELPPQCRPGGWKGIVFLHVPKAAGSYYREQVLRRIGQWQKNMLKYCQPPDPLFYTCPKATDTQLRNRELAYYASAFLKNCTFLSSHNDHSLIDRITSPDPKINATVAFNAPPAIPVFKILPVRDPLDLTTSLYHHIHYHYSDKAPKIPFSAWVVGQMSNLQTRMLLGDRGCFGSHTRIDAMTDDEIRSAIAARLNSVCVVLLQDETRAGVAFLNYALGWGIGPHQLEIIASKEMNKAGKSSVVESLKTKENAKLVAEHYKHDLVLLEMARRRVEWQNSFLDDGGGGTLGHETA